MANPILIPLAFALNGAKNVIQKFRQPSQGEDAATWDEGWGLRTMLPKETGGLPPDGRDFNGVLYVLSDHAVHRQNGEQIKFDATKIAEVGGYPKGAMIFSDDNMRTYKSLIDNNTSNPNTENIAGKWMIYAGDGSIPASSSTVAGLLKVINSLTSNDAGSALSAAMGKFIYDRMLGNGQQMYHYWIGGNAGSERRKLNTVYKNETGRTITVFTGTLSSGTITNNDVIIFINGITAMSCSFSQNRGDKNSVSFPVPAGATYEFRDASNPNNKEDLPISELR